MKMGTKNNPGAFDCYANAAPDEPMFVLLGRDPEAPVLVEAWADAREHLGEDAQKVNEARACADQMRVWLKKIGKQERNGDCGPGTLLVGSKGGQVVLQAPPGITASWFGFSPDEARHLAEVLMKRADEAEDVR